MLVLALDTTTRAGSVAVTRNDQVLTIVEGDPTRTHGERLPAEIETALERAGVKASELDLLVVGAGPGAFTGLRIGLATVQGLAMVLRTPVVGISALDALADAALMDLSIAPPIVAWMDAQRGEVFSACYNAAASTPIEPPTVGPPEWMLAHLPVMDSSRLTFIGDGALKHESIIRAIRGGDTQIVGHPHSLAPILARLGRLQAARGAAGPPHALQPLYVRRPDAEIDREREAKV